ncbi:Cytochrome b5 domain-containing protein 1 [Clydaea vesicula]|uniref:Cytochrome b5 domain-containing protein 1 n=1 Tax=Clydaea vesicula TaxID=447962 RepID=A0AAD5XYL7_9FUNG|nr:Cytochrome b5 domain-containing protein 1 [Clydaea vesicula]KAJ3384959.1 Cytochrome b5 domain-containing protein 1 [Lobulomyces angularis]
MPPNDDREVHTAESNKSCISENSKLLQQFPEKASAVTSTSARNYKSLVAKKDIKVNEIFYSRNEVALHNSPDDLWLSWLGYVYDLTELSQEYNDDPLLTPILRNAGTDISHWFNPLTGDLKTHINPLTGCECPYTPEGRFLHVPPPLPRSDWNSSELDQTPWWLEKSYCIGTLSKKTRFLKIINTLTKDEHTIEVCSEEKITAIQDRYTSLNAHAKGYMWKRLGVLLDMNATLEQNGVVDSSNVFEEIGLSEDDWYPAIHLFFSDDLTVA